MPFPIVEGLALVTCSHAGKGTPANVSTRVFIEGSPVVTLATIYAIAGCSLAASTGPFDLTGSFTAGAERVFSEGVPLAVAPGESACLATANPLLVAEPQTRAVAS
jgi:hypothetical protein